MLAGQPWQADYRRLLEAALPGISAPHTGNKPAAGHRIIASDTEDREEKGRWRFPILVYNGKRVVFFGELNDLSAICTSSADPVCFADGSLRYFFECD